jgi:DNA-binding response OmpR family regulator
MTGKDRCILVIDDDHAVLDHVGTVLQGAGYRMIRATNGLDGLKQLNSVETDLVILDVTMPEMDGLQTCRMIRATDKHKNVPILFLTSRGDITDMMEARKVGADDYLVKPVEGDLLLKKIDRLFAR